MTILAGCASATGAGGVKAGIGEGKEGKGISRIELQDSLFRFEMSFGENLREALRGSIEAAPSSTLHTQALRNWVVYASSSLSIALGSSPESNLLDMMVFIELCRNVFARHWIPEFYGDKGQPVLAAFKQGWADLSVIAAKVLTPTQIAKFQEVVDRWSAAHPDQVSVEGIRLSQIAAETGAEAAEVQEQASGLLSNIKQATISADQAVLLGERFLYYAQRAPFLLRAQSRLGIEEILAEVTPAGMEGFGTGFQQAAIRGNALLTDGALFFRDARELMGLIHRDLARVERFSGGLEAGTDRLLIKATLALMSVVAFAGIVILGVRVASVRLAPHPEGRRREREYAEEKNEDAAA
jgi:hypothetical protein